ncbi:hypothetical protein V8E52_012048 [Russula decolorans]|jgi:hypothetical protein
MPSRHSQHAPYFSSRHGDPIEDFLDEYEELANSHGLTSREKVKTIIRYISRSLRDLWESLDSYSARDWTDFRLALKKIHKATPTPDCRASYSEERLLDFIQRTSKSYLCDERDVL